MKHALSVSVTRAACIIVATGVKREGLVSSKYECGSLRRRLPAHKDRPSSFTSNEKHFDVIRCLMASVVK